MNRLSYSVGVQQRVLPAYRLPFFELLAGACPAGMQVFFGQPRNNETVETPTDLPADRYLPGRTIHLLSGKAYFYLQPGLLAWLRSHRPRALIMEINPRNRSLAPAIRQMHAHTGAVIGWGLGAPPQNGLLGSFNRAFQGSLVRRLDAVIAYSRRGAREYASLGVPEQRIIVAPNAVIQPAAQPPGAPGTAVMGGQPVVLYVGRLQPRKKVDLLLQAASDLEPGLRPSIWIVGEGPDRPRLEAQAAQLPVSVRFFGGVFGDALEDIYNQASVFVLPGTGGLALQQAMAHGLAVIAAEGDGTQEDLVRWDTGWLVEPGSLASLRAALARALSDPERLLRYGQNAWRLVKDEINLNNMVERFLEAVEIAMGVKHAHHGRG